MTDARPAPDAELRTIGVFADLTDAELAAIASLGEFAEYEDGDVIFREGDEAVWMVAVVDGAIRARREQGGSGRLFLMDRGDVGGVLPFSRMTHVGVTGRAVGRSRLFVIHRREFPKMLATAPILADRLVGVMSDRIREVSVVEQQQDKMAALGRLAAGLAHELNNPATAVLRSSGSLRDTLQALREASAEAAKWRTSERSDEVLALEAELLGTGAAPVPIDALERVECEEELAAWLEEREVDEAWELAPALVEAGVDMGTLERALGIVGRDALGYLVRRLARLQQAERLLEEIDACARRIVGLVDAVKQYSFMDQAPLQEIDVHEGIRNTLLILGHTLADLRIEVKTDFDTSMPQIAAYGAELNQVWTNLIENAADAMPGGGTLRIRTEAHPTFISVEISDTGRGILADVLPRIFEPFFTTKPVGKGSGLGLDSVNRIVRRHNGDVRVESGPGDTRFWVTIPTLQDRD